MITLILFLSTTALLAGLVDAHLRLRRQNEELHFAARDLFDADVFHEAEIERLERLVAEVENARDSSNKCLEMMVLENAGTLEHEDLIHIFQTHKE